MTAQHAKAPAPTPENTPIPGGGSWRWTPSGWVENTPAADPAPAANPDATALTLE